MFKVRFSFTSTKQLQSFIRSYKDLFLSLYSDTGVYDESIIRKNYIDLSLKIDKDIRTEAQLLLAPQVILGRKKLSNEIFRISYSVGNFLIIIEYTEDLRLLERTIMNIIFNKK